MIQIFDIYIYDSDLNFLSREKYDGVPILNFAKLNSDKLLVHSHYDQDYTYTLYSYKSNQDLIKQYIPDMNYSGNQFLARPISIGAGEGSSLLVSPFDYNIYQFNEEGVFSKYYLDFGKLKITRDDVKKNGVRGNWKLIKKGQRVFSPHGIAQSNNFLLFQVFYKRDSMYYIYSFNTEKTFRLNDYFEKGILPKCDIRGVLEKNIFYAIVDPKDMIEFQENTNQKLFKGEISSQQNPFLITFNISELE